MMKNYIYTLIAITMIATSATAQNITFADPDTLPALLEQDPPIDTNNDGQISEAEAAVVTVLDLEVEFIGTFEEVVFFTNLEELYIARNIMTGTLDLSQAPNLRIVDASPINELEEVIFYTDGPSVYEILNFADNFITSPIIIGNNTSAMENVDFVGSSIPYFEIGGSPLIERLDLRGNDITEIVLNNVLKLDQFFVNGNKLGAIDLCSLTSAEPGTEYFIAPQDSTDGQDQIYSYDTNLDITFSGPMIEDFQGFDCNGEPLGLDDQLSESLNIYPNPVTDVLNVNSSSFELKSYVIYNVSGTVVARGNTFPIDTAALSSGLYIVEVGNENAKSVRKIVKR